MIINLVYEFPHPGEKYLVQSNFWNIKRKSTFEYESNFSLPFCDYKQFYQIVTYGDRMLLIWWIIERMLFGRSIIITSSDKSKLIAWSEILKNIIYPFEFPGLILPYMWRIDMTLLTSEISYIIGLPSDWIKHIKPSLNHNTIIFDIDLREIHTNKRDLIKISPTETIISQDSKSKDDIFCELPSSLYFPKIKELESKVKDFPKTQSESKVRAYVNKIREHFVNFFINDLLDYKNWDYNHEEIYLSAKRKKAISKDHYEFIRIFSKTQTFKNFQLMTRKIGSTNERRFNDLVKRFQAKGGKSEELKIEDNRVAIQIDKSILHFNFNNLQDKYYSESDFIPIKQIFTAHKAVETTFYRYILFPKLLNVIASNSNLVNTISWPIESHSKMSKHNAARDIFKPEQQYTFENIWDIIWISWWLGTYWYHENSEKQIQLNQLLSVIPKMKLSKRQLKLIISQIFDILSVFGKPSIIAENLSFMIYFLSTTKISSVDWSYQNQLMLALQKISLGLSLVIDYRKINNQSRTTYAKEIDLNLPQFALKPSLNDTESSINMNHYGQSLFKSLTIDNETTADAYESKLIKAELLSNRRVIHEEAFEWSKSITRREIAQESIFIHELNKYENKRDEVMDRDKRNYKEVILK